MAGEYTSADIAINAKDHTKAGITSAKKGIGGLTKTVRSYGAEIAAVVGAIYGAIRAVKGLTDAYAKQQTSITQMESALRATGKYTPELSQEIQELARQLQKTTVYGDEVTLTATSLLQSLGSLSASGLKQAIPLVQELAAGMHMDLEMAASLVGKTLGSTTNALSRYGIVLDATASPSEKLSQLTDQINQKFGGMAEALGNTFQGRMQKLKNAYGDIKEILGSFIATEAEPFMKWLLDFLQNGRNIEIISRVVRGFGATIVIVFGLAINYIKTLVKYYEIWANAAITAGKIIKIAFNPREWGKGEMKAALTDLKDYTVQAAKDIYDNWETYVINTMDRWNRVMKGEVVPTIKGANVEYNLMTGQAAETTDEWANTIVYAGERLDSYLEQLQSAREGQKYLTDSVKESDDFVKNLINTFGIYNENAYDMGQANADLVASTNELNDAYKFFGVTTEDVSRRFQISMMSAWMSVWNVTQSMKENIKDALKNLFVSLLQMIGKQLIIAAGGYLLTLQWAKAAAAVALSASAFAAASLISSFQQGGVIKAQQGYGGGDVVPAMLEPGEMVIRKEIVRENQPALNAINSGQGFSPIINVYLDGKKISGTITKWTENGDLRIAPQAVK